MKRTYRKILILGALVTSLVIIAGCSDSTDSTDNMDGMDHSSMEKGQSNGMDGVTEGNMNAPYDVLTGSKFSLTAKESHLMVNESNMRTAWTFNGTVPGPQIRVKLGDNVEIKLKNDLDEPTTIHWHGLPVPNNMDGIPGVTMNAVQPGESFTYKFNANVPGTYWYHSHQDGIVQLDKGLYGTFIVEDPKERKADREYTIVLDDWMEDEEANHGSMNMSSMDMGAMDHNAMDSDSMITQSADNNNISTNGMSDAEMMPLMYTIFTANGKSGATIEPLSVKEGETVRIRFINAGFLSHPLYLQGHEYKIISTDGQSINNPPLVNGQLLNVAPGERYDIEFVANNPGSWLLEERSTNPGAAGLTIPVKYEGVDGDFTRDNEQRAVIDITQYGEATTAQFSIEDEYDLEYTMNLNTAIVDGSTTYTINGERFPETDPLKVQEGDLIKVKLINNSPEDVHPMHLHGHFFQVLSKNGKPISGSPLVKDTINILPGEEYEVAFKADNSGNWLFHCHDLGHASAGMVTQVIYNGYTPDFEADPKAGNKPE